MTTLCINPLLADVDLSAVIAQMTGHPAWIDVETILESTPLTYAERSEAARSIYAELRQVVNTAFLAGVRAGQDPLVMLADCADRLERACARMETAVQP